ncbi:MAG: (S)-ureidoglycine aminohydrolase [Bryobacteraceae bacterium]
MSCIHAFGSTRTAYRRDHILQTPDTFVRASLPGMKDCTAIVHTGPASGAGFTEYTAEMEPRGQLGPASGQRFLYVLEGSVALSGTDGNVLNRGGYAYMPPGDLTAVVAEEKSRIVVIEKQYEKLEDCAVPRAFHGSEDRIQAQALLGDEDLQVRSLIPAGIEYDFAVNTMTFQPGASLAAVEMHVMEHGLLMLDGGGVYRLGDYWYPVSAGDFIWMAPYCPQWFGALGKKPARYLIYKDWNRHPVARVAL